jgi:hypothetical protein
MANSENSTVDSEIPPASGIRNIIPDALRQIIDSQLGENITGANHLTRTAAGQVVPPSGQAVVEGMDLDMIAEDFGSTVNSKLAADLFQIPEELLRNSPKSVVTNPVPVESLTTIPINDLGKAKVFTDANQRQSLFERIRGASLGAEQYSFVDADDADNLIEIEAVDAAQGGLRAWGGDDHILGTDVNDIVSGNGGSDKIVGAGGNDLLQGGQGNDLIAAGEGDDLLLGNKGNDALYGGAGNDVIRGGKGTDVLMGNAGNDILISGAGEEGDFLMGSTGADQFILRAETLANNAAQANRILDFNPREGDLMKIAYFDGTLTVPEITFAAVDVNLDRIQDTAILCSQGVVGVMLGIDPTQTNLTSSILMVNPKDTALSMIGDHF